MKKLVSFLLCFTLIIGIMPMSFAARDISFEETLAQDLKQLDLFYGVANNDFDLGRAPTRIEALVMLIRVLGNEKEALSGEWKHPFTDVPAWADKYVGYGYENGLANGVGLTTFGTGRANAAMYITFMLRALGYSDARGEFTWDNPFALAKNVGILSNGVDTANFWRADVVLVSYAALDVEVKGSGRKLSDILITAGVFTRDEYDAYYDKDAISQKYPTRVAKTAEDIYKDSEDAVFYIEVYDENGRAYGNGSGFFIDSNGTAVTNFHVIDSASAAYIQLADEESVYEVEGIYHYSEENDWAVIKVKGSGFNYIPINTEEALTTGSVVYALGSPLGLQNTFSEGIISNPKRVVDGTPYIQITAPISHGSSGGALLNKYGEVIGITSAGFADAQNLNLAVPLTIVDTSKTSYIMGFDEVNQIANMMDGGSSSTQSGKTRQEQAFNALKSYILTNSNYTVEKMPSRREVSHTESGTEIWYTMTYSSAYNRIILTTTAYNGSELVVLNTSLSSIEENCYMTYTYENEYLSYKNYSGEMTFAPSQLESNVMAMMEQTDGASYLSESELREHYELAGTMLEVLFVWTDKEIKKGTGNKYSVADFGFVNLYNQ